MRKYSFIISHNGKEKTIYTNSIEEIDNMISKTNAYSVEDLFSTFSTFTNDEDGYYKFKIVNSDGVEKHLIYKDQIDKIKTFDNSFMKEILFEEIITSEKFRYKFLDQFVFPIRNINNKLGEKARQLFDRNVAYFGSLDKENKSAQEKLLKMFQDSFNAFYNSLVTTSRNGLLVENYSKKRSMLNLYIYYKTGYPITSYMNDNYEYDSFDEEMLYDQNSSDRLTEEQKEYYENLKHAIDEGKIKEPVKTKKIGTYSSNLPHYQESFNFDDE